MKGFSVLIADDEPIARRGIRHLLAPHGDFEILGEARNGSEAVRMLKALGPDIVFLDVQMPELDGFAVLRQLNPEQVPAVIFVTAYDRYAVHAFDLYALDYLVKPVHAERFEQALARVRERLRSKEAIELSRRLSTLLSTGTLGKVDDGRETPRGLLVGTNGRNLFLAVEEIEWIEAEDYYAAIHAGGQRHLIRESLASLEARLDHSQFVRVHRAAIVNLAHVREIRGGFSEDPSVVLRDGTHIRLSRRRREIVASAIRRFAR